MWANRVAGVPMSIAVKLSALEGANAEQGVFVRRAVERLGEALASPGFLRQIEEAEYIETRWAPADGRWRSLTPGEIAARIAAGCERGGAADRAIDLSLDLIDLPGPESGKKVLGSTALGTQPVHTARWFVDLCAERGDTVNLASHLMHEWCHVSGFYHWPDNKARGDTAYVVGRLVREALEARYRNEIDPEITALMHDVETDCGCRGEVEGETW